MDLKKFFTNPKKVKAAMLLAAHCGAFMQDFKMAIWQGMAGGNRISEAQLDEIAMKLYDKWIAKKKKPYVSNKTTKK